MVSGAWAFMILGLRSKALDGFFGVGCDASGFSGKGLGRRRV